MKKKKIVGFFGGSFDPIHFGHLALAIQLLEAHHLDEIWFCPAFCSPFKIANPPLASGEHRLEMLKLALDHPAFRLCSWEVERGTCSYTIDTLRALQTENSKFRLLLSDESATHLDRWKETQELLELASPLVGHREMEISSTEVRARLKKNLYCGHLIPAKALDYIKTHRLYLP